jgi:hypothetical protein
VHYLLAVLQGVGAMISYRTRAQLLRASFIVYFIAIAAGGIWLTVWLLERLV